VSGVWQVGKGRFRAVVVGGEEPPETDAVFEGDWGGCLVLVADWPISASLLVTLYRIPDGRETFLEI
jgi:hypothetical protein